jgi:hypothetical protein
MGPRTIKLKIPAIQPDPSDLLTLLELHLSWYPLMELQDVYKLLYQGVMGAEHLMPSREEYTRYLEAEFEPLLPDPTERLLEPVRPDGALYRLNLRPYKARHLSLDQLISYLVETANVVKCTKSGFITAWAEFTQLCLQGQIQQFDAKAIDEFTHWLEQIGYPALHHSETYGREYIPAYRLIADRSIPELGLE